MYNLNLKAVDFVLLQHRDILKNKLFRWDLELRFKTDDDAWERWKLGMKI